MAISFNSIVDLNIPFVSVEFDNTQAQQGPAIQPHQVLAMGQKTASGTQAELTLVTVTSEAQAVSLFGRGSMLHWIVKRYLANNRVTALKCVAIDDVGAGVAATGTLTVTGPATGNGTVAVYIAGQRVVALVTDGDTADDVAAAINAAINANADLQVTSSVTTNVVTVTAKHKGVVGNKISLRVNLRDDDEFPAGISVAPPASLTLSSGTTNPDAQEIFDILPEEQFNTLINPWTDSGNLTAVEDYLTTQFGPSSAKDGFSISWEFDTLNNLITLGNGRNSPHSSINAYATKLIETPWEHAAAEAGQVSLSAQADPARPFQTLPLIGMTPVPESERFIDSERNILLSDGIGTCKVVASTIQIERLVSTFQLNVAAQPDDSLQDAETLYTLSFLRYSFRNRFASKFPRHKLVDDGNRVAPGQPVITPAIARAEAISLFGEWAEAVLVENADQFAADLVVERNASNPNRLDFLLPPDLANQLRNIAAQIQFRL